MHACIHTCMHTQTSCAEPKHVHASGRRCAPATPKSHMPRLFYGQPPHVHAATVHAIGSGDSIAYSNADVHRRCRPLASIYRSELRALASARVDWGAPLGCLVYAYVRYERIVRHDSHGTAPRAMAAHCGARVQESFGA
jgi:hypothetical protein